MQGIHAVTQKLQEFFEIGRSWQDLDGVKELVETTRYDLKRATAVYEKILGGPNYVAFPAEVERLPRKNRSPD